MVGIEAPGSGEDLRMDVEDVLVPIRLREFVGLMPVMDGDSLNHRLLTILNPGRRS